MSKRLRGFLAAVLVVTLAGLLALPMVAPAQVRTPSGTYYRFFQLQNEYDEPFTTDGFANCSIYQHDANNNSIYSYTHSAATLSQASAQAGPLYSNVNGIIHWYSATNLPVDVVCFTKGGDSGRKVRMRAEEHKLRINTSGTQKVVRFPFVNNTAVTLTGIYIPQGALVTNVALQLATPGATVSHINVGFGGNHTVSYRHALAYQMQIGPGDAVNPTRGFNTFTFTDAPNGAAAPDGGIQSTPSLHLGVLLRHVSSRQSIGLTTNPNTIVATYNGGAMVHIAGGLELTYDTRNVAVTGGHVFVFFTLVHVGSTVHGPGY